MIELKLLKYVTNEIKANDIAKKRYANQLAPNFSVFNYIFTNELMLNKIISDLLSPQGDHGQQESFLNLFLKMLSNNSSYDQYDIQKSKIYCEEVTFGVKSQRRMDILIHIEHLELNNQKFGICIENKPFASDQNNQLIDYAKELNYRYDASHWHIVYLNGHSSEPEENSVDNIQLLEWIEKNKISILGYENIADWIKECITYTQNSRVSYFLSEFLKYIQITFLSIDDMAEKTHLLKTIESNQEYLSAALEIISLKDDLQNNLVLKFTKQLESKISEKNQWHSISNLCRNKKNCTFQIFFKAEQKIVFMLEFDRLNYQGFFFGMRKVDENIEENKETWNSILNCIQEEYKTTYIKQSKWWPAYIQLQSYINWQTQNQVWTEIDNGQFPETIFEYVKTFHKVLEENNLIEIL